MKISEPQPVKSQNKRCRVHKTIEDLIRERDRSSHCLTIVRTPGKPGGVHFTGPSNVGYSDVLHLWRLFDGQPWAHGADLVRWLGGRTCRSTAQIVTRLLQPFVKAPNGLGVVELLTPERAKAVTPCYIYIVGPEDPSDSDGKPPRLLLNVYRSAEEMGRGEAIYLGLLEDYKAKPPKEAPKPRPAKYKQGDDSLDSWMRSLGLSKPPNMIEALRANYPDYDAVLAFAKKNKLPKGKCSVSAAPRDDGHSCSYGYSNSLEHVAAAICAVLEEEAQGEDQWDAASLRVRRDGPTVFVCVENYDYIWFTPLTPAKEKEARAEWVSHALALEKNKPRAEQIAPNRLRKLLSKHDPFEANLIQPYMPGGAWLKLKQ